MKKIYSKILYIFLFSLFFLKKVIAKEVDLTNFESGGLGTDYPGGLGHEFTVMNINMLTFFSGLFLFLVFFWSSIRWLLVGKNKILSKKMEKRIKISLIGFLSVFIIGYSISWAVNKYWFLFW